MARFTVDTHLFRELGDLLVGRDSTALVELIKNAYDADATEVTVYGENLDDIENGVIIVVDDGIGMTGEEFAVGFLRIAGRAKELGDRRSLVYKRRLTGAKGIGRLAAHKLARRLHVTSTSSKSGMSSSLISAEIDWDAVERHETLEQLPDDVVRLTVRTVRKPSSPSGTELRLSRLRRPWTAQERSRFFFEVNSFHPPTFLTERLSSSIVEEVLLFREPIVRDVGSFADAHRFLVSLEGEFAAGEDYWMLAANNASWILEIRSSVDGIDYAVSPTVRVAKENRNARPHRFHVPQLDPERGPFFDARIFVREGRLKSVRADQRVWASLASGIRVYLEGFRVLPYGDPHDDWLGIDREYTRRHRQLELLQDLPVTVKGRDPDEGLIRLPSNNYFGAIFLTQENARCMRMLVNREGFVPEATFDNLVKIVKVGIDLCTRARAAAAYTRRHARRVQRASSPGRTDDYSDTADGLPPVVHLNQRLEETVRLVDAARSTIGDGDPSVAKMALDAVRTSIAETKVIVDDSISEYAMFRVLASVGTQMAAFVHEINALLGSAQAIEKGVTRVLSQEVPGLTRENRKTLRDVLRVSEDLRRGLERQASYLIDVITPDARRRRTRQSLSDRFDGAARLVSRVASSLGVAIENHIPAELKSPPMFPAELTTVFANVLTNAVKAAGQGGRIHATGFVDSQAVVVRVENTGVAVSESDGERWFRPFESTTTALHPVLGQGMGLGLPITRSVLESYGASISFVSPTKPFTTCIQINFPR